METVAKRPKPVVGGIILALDAVLLYLASISPFMPLISIVQGLTSGEPGQILRVSANIPLFFKITGHPAFLVASLLFAIFAVVYNARAVNRDKPRTAWWVVFLVFSILILIPMFGSVLMGLVMGGPFREISGTIK